MHSKSHNALRANVLKTIRKKNVLHEQLDTLFNEKKRERLYYKKLKSDVRELMKLPLFQQYTSFALDKVKKIKDGHFYDNIQHAASTFYTPLLRLCQNSDKTDKEKNWSKIVLILITICFTKYLYLCNYLSALMSFLLYSTSVKQHVFSLSNTFGLTKLYNRILRTIQSF